MDIVEIIPVLPSADIQRDIAWYDQYAGFKKYFADTRYAVLYRDRFALHLQWHADTENDPLLGGSVIRIRVNDIEPFFAEFVKRGTITPDKIRRHTPWGTHEFGFFDLNNNAVFIMQDLA